jgi:WD40 repeat protein
MFIFDVDQPQIVYTAEDLGRGIISRVDLRTNVVDTIFSTRYLNLDAMFNGVRCVTETMSSVKALAQNDVYGGSQLLIGGGRSFSLGLLDVRCLSPVPTGTDVDYEITGSQFVKKWEPQRHPHLQNKISKHRMNGVSVSGLTFSANGASILASYQGDQIYIFETFGESSKIATKEVSVPNVKNANEPPLLNSAAVPRIGPRSLLGGHINHATFLKSVAFFGPKDEYVVSGSDSGHLWVWDATSGNLDVLEAHDRTCRVINFLKAGMFYLYFLSRSPYLIIVGHFIFSSCFIYIFCQRNKFRYNPT